MIDIRAISKRIEDRRNQIGISQSEFARMIGVSPACIARWETEANLLKPKNLVLACSILGLSVDDIISKDNINNYNSKLNLIDYIDEDGNFNVDSNNVEDFINEYNSILSEARNLYLLKLKKEHYDFERLNYILKIIHDGTMVLDGGQSFHFHGYVLKIYKIDFDFNHEDLDYVYHVNNFYTNYTDLYFEIKKMDYVIYMDEEIDYDYNHFENHSEIKKNTWFVQDENGNRAIIEKVKLLDLDYNPLVHNINTFDRMYSIKGIDDKVLELCVNKIDALEQYLLCITGRRYKAIKQKYITNYLMKNKNYLYGDVFMKIDYIKKYD